MQEQLLSTEELINAACMTYINEMLDDPNIFTVVQFFKTGLEHILLKEFTSYYKMELQEEDDIKAYIDGLSTACNIIWNNTPEILYPKVSSTVNKAASQFLRHTESVRNEACQILKPDIANGIFDKYTKAFNLAVSICNTPAFDGDKSGELFEENIKSMSEAYAFIDGLAVVGINLLRLYETERATLN